MFSFFGEPKFPSPQSADCDGLVRVGGRLNVRWLLAAYSRGIFPWPLDTGHGHVLAWFSPDPRAILELDSLHVSTRLARRVRSGIFDVSINQAFARVIADCARPRSPESGTWITPGLLKSYIELHQAGHAHSVEVWKQGELVGGVYGMAMGGYFSAESMFHRATDASKVALVHLVQHLRERGFTLLDVQVPSNHLKSLGATTISRDVFLARHAAALKMQATFTNHV